MCKKHTKLRSQTFCILLHCVVGLPCVYSACSGVNVTVATYPADTIAVRSGDPLEIFCVAEGYTSDDVQFQFSGKPIESERINDTTRRLYIDSPQRQLTSVHCRNKKTSKVCVTRVSVDTAPSNVTDFHCISRNLDNLKCSWSYPVSYSRIDYGVMFDLRGRRVGPPCHPRTEKVSGKRFVYCTWNTTSLPRYRQLEPTQGFYLTACNIFGCNNQSFAIDHYSIVKSDPPWFLRVVDSDAHSVQLAWDIPLNIIHLYPPGVEHIVEYRIANDNDTDFIRVNGPPVDSLRSERVRSFQLRDLPYANMQYEVRVYIKTKAESRDYWSDFSSIVFRTASERPRSPPEVITGGFEEGAFAGRTFFVYWKRLDVYEEAGVNFTYKATVKQGNETFSITFPENYKSPSFIIKDVSAEPLHVKVWSVNAVGLSLNSSDMYIPSYEDTQMLRVTSLSVVSHENGTYELNWSGLKDVDNFTVFWCYHIVRHICLDDIHFATADPRKNNYVIDLPGEQRYQFAISANHGTKSSGMVWATSEMSKHGFTLEKCPVRLRYGPPSKSQVHLGWSIDCSLSNEVVTGYNVSYCPVTETSSDRDKTNGYTFISDPKQMHVTIKDLLPFETYQFTLSIITNGGSSIKDISTLVTTPEDAPSSPRNVKVESSLLSWDPPLHRNGNVGKYVIYNHGKKIYVDQVSGTDEARRQVTLTELAGSTNHSLTVKACNAIIGLCSEPSPAVFP